MPHPPRPFFRTARRAWFVQVGDRQINHGIMEPFVFNGLTKRSLAVSSNVMTQAFENKILKTSRAVHPSEICC